MRLASNRGTPADGLYRSVRPCAKGEVAVPHHKIAYRTEDGKHVAEGLRHAPAGERPEIPLKGEVVDLDGHRWTVKEVRLYPSSDSVVVVLVPA
jgi:hypothetical protein